MQLYKSTVSDLNVNSCSTYTGLAAGAPARGTLTSESDELSDSESEPLKNRDIFFLFN